MASLAMAGALAAAEGEVGEATPIAVYRGGVVERAELDDWKAFRRQIGGRPEKRSDRWHVRQIVLLRALGERFEAARAVHEPELEVWRGVLEARLAEALLNEQLRASSSPSEAELRQRYEQDPGRFRAAKRWHLENIFLRAAESATEAERQELASRLEGLRQQILEGADFAALARRESESQTRARGGRMGTVTLERLPQELAQGVAKMKAGDLSRIIPTGEGFTLLRCTGVVPARPGDFISARPKLEQELRREHLGNRWAELRGVILDAARPRYSGQGVGKDAPPEQALATFQGAAGEQSLTYRELDFYRRDRGIRAALWQMTPSELKRHLESAVVLQGVHEEARRRGLLARESHQRRLRWERRELRAELVRRAVTRRQLEPVSEAQIRGEFERRRDQLVKPPEMHLRWLETRIDETLGRDFYRRARRVGEQLATGAKTLAEAGDELGPRFAFSDLGWKTDKGVWMLGLNLEQAVRDLAAGSATGLVQEGRSLYLIEVVGRRESRAMTLAEARPQIERSLASWRQRQIRRRFDEQVLAELSLEWPP